MTSQDPRYPLVILCFPQKLSSLGTRRVPGTYNGAWLTAAPGRHVLNDMVQALPRKLREIEVLRNEGTFLLFRRQGFVAELKVEPTS